MCFTVVVAGALLWLFLSAVSCHHFLGRNRSFTEVPHIPDGYSLVDLSHNHIKTLLLAASGHWINALF